MDVAHVYGGASAADASDSDDGDTSDGLEDAAGAPVGRRPGDRARHINPQLMQVWVYQRDALGWSAEYIAEVNRTFDNIICAKTVRRALKRWDDTGLVDYPPRKARQVAVGPDERKVLKDIINAEPYLYLSEIAAEFNFRMGTHLSREHIHGALIKANLSLKKGQERRRARCEELRALYWQFIYQEVPDPSWLVFADETSLDGRALRRKRGWSERGKPVVITDLYHRGTRISILAVFTYDGTVKFRWVVKAYTAEFFMDHIVELIDEVIRPLPGPSCILVLDNCAIHHTHEDELRAACARKGGQCIFLAPYAPDDNPIEKVFNAFKLRWRADAALLVHMDTTAAIEACFRLSNTEQAEKTYASCAYDAEVMREMYRMCVRV